MGRPGTGLAGRVLGIPGRGAAGAPGLGGFARRATISGRGGTTGRAAGWPARFGFAGGRRGLPPPTGAAGAGVPGAAGAAGLIGAGRGVGILGTELAATGPGIGTVRGAPGAGGGGGGAFGASPIAAGRGCRGPDRICPGRGAGTGRAGIAEPRGGARGGAIGCPVDNGGRSGFTGRTGGAGSSETSLCASTAAGTSGFVTGSDLVSNFAAGSAFATGWASGASATGAEGISSWMCAAGSAGSSMAGRVDPFSPVTRCRIWRATSSSRELEWVFLSMTPNSGNKSRMTFGLTSSSRASSLMRILLIRWHPGANSSDTRAR
jgi:hypothetical protein